MFQVIWLKVFLSKFFVRLFFWWKISFSLSLALLFVPKSIDALQHFLSPTYSLCTKPRYVGCCNKWQLIEWPIPDNNHCWGSITVWLVSSFTSLDSTASLHTNNNIFSVLVKSSLVKVESVSVLWNSLYRPKKALCTYWVLLLGKQFFLFSFSIYLSA